MFISPHTFCSPGKRGGLVGVPLLCFWPGLVVMLPRPDHPAPRAALFQALCRRRLYFAHSQELKEWLPEEDAGAGQPCFSPTPETPQSRLRRTAELQWRKLQAPGAGERHQPAEE